MRVPGIMLLRESGEAAGVPGNQSLPIGSDSRRLGRMEFTGSINSVSS